MKNKPGKQTDSVVFLRAKFHAKLFIVFGNWFIISNYKSGRWSLERFSGWLVASG